MAEPTPTSEIAIAIAQLRRMLALSGTFQAELCEPGYARALRAVHTRSVEPELEPRPYVVLMPGETHGFELVAGGSQNHLRQSGSLAAYMARDISAEHETDGVAAGLEAENFFGAVLEDIADLAGKDDPESEFERSHLAITRMTRLSFAPVPFESRQAVPGFWFAVYLIEWGDGA